MCRFNLSARDGFLRGHKNTTSEADIERSGPENTIRHNKYQDQRQSERRQRLPIIKTFGLQKPKEAPNPRLYAGNPGYVVSQDSYVTLGGPTTRRA